MRYDGYGWRIEMFRIITIEREYGAGGSLVAAELARRKGWQLLDQQLTAEIAKLACVDTRVVAVAKKSAKHSCIVSPRSSGGAATSAHCRFRMTKSSMPTPWLNSPIA